MLILYHVISSHFMLLSFHIIWRLVYHIMSYETTSYCLMLSQYFVKLHTCCSIILLQRPNYDLFIFSFIYSSVHLSIKLFIYDYYSYTYSFIPLVIDLFIYLFTSICLLPFIYSNEISTI